MVGPRTVPGLEGFLASLRFRGLPIGVREQTWLQHAFLQAPPIDETAFRSLLRATLAKTEEERDLFDRAMEQWLRDASPLFEGPADAEDRESSGSLPPESLGNASAAELERDRPAEPPLSDPPPHARWVRVLGIASAIVVLGAGTWLLYRPGQTAEGTQLPAEAPPRVAETAGATEPEEGVTTGPEIVLDAWAPNQPRAEYTEQYVSARIHPPPSFLSRYLPWAAASLLLGLSLLGRRRTQPEPAQPTGPAFLPLLPLADFVGQCVPESERRRLIWNVERFVSDDLTRHLDLERTVQATAREAGMPSLRRARAIYPREVWLWRDRATHSSALDSLVRDLARNLRRAGLPVRLATFHRLPSRVVNEDGHLLRPQAMEGHAQQAFVVLLTDGAGLRRALDSAMDSASTRRLLAALARWPKLAFADFGDGANGLSRIAAEYGIPCHTPDQVTPFLAGERLEPFQRRAPRELTGELAYWATALSLAREPFDTNTALAVHAHLGLALPALSGLQDLLVHCASLGGDRFVVPDPEQRLQWLRNVEGHAPARPLRADARVARAATFWVQRYERDLARRRIAMPTFGGSPAEARLELRRAVLLLWTDPEQAASELARLDRGPLVEEVREDLREELQRLRKTFEADAAEQQPWAAPELSVDARKALGELGLIPPVSARNPVRWWASAPAGVALFTGLVGAWVTLEAAPSGPPSIELPSKAAPLRVQETLAGGSGMYDIVLGSRRSPTVLREVPAGSRVVATVAPRALPSVVAERDGGPELFRCGSLEHPIRWAPEEAAARSLVILLYDPADDPADGPADGSARKLALRLLDLGVADLVWLGTTPPAPDRDLELWHDQRIVIGPSREALQEVEERWSIARRSVARRLHLKVGDAAGDLLGALNGLRGPVRLADLAGWAIADLPGAERNPAHDLLVCGWTDLSSLPGGVFTMGSHGDEPGHQSDEIQHEVALSPFAIGRFEVTRGWYRRLLPKERWPEDWEGGSEHLPATNVTWDDAQAFCRALSEKLGLDPAAGFRLPTEAQWEYACRGGTQTAYWSGNTEPDLERVGWSLKNSGGRVHAVGEKPANAYGLYDVHGNVWEWCAGWYGEHPSDEAEPLQDPSGPDEGAGVRVVRGGSFRDGAVWCRSACRGGNWPGNRGDSVGFRVALPVAEARSSKLE